MLKQIEGSHAMAEGIALCRPEVICAYPITPQTHIVEGVGELVRTGELKNCEFINVELEFAALSVAIGASAAGARAYTATSSQGLLFMAEAVYNASGLGLPIVMTLGNRAIGAPINIWNDHSDAMSMRDAGWMQLFAETNQEAVDLHIQAFRLAEELSMPIMVCVDGFILTHAVERIDIPDQADVDAYLPPYEPVQVLDPANPISIGAMVGPDAFTEVRFLQHYKQNLALRLIPELAAEFKTRFGRESGGLLRTYRTEDAELLVVAMGSVNGTIKDTIDEMRADGVRIGLVTLVSFRPFPTQALREVLVGTKHVVVIEKSFAVGMGGQLANNVDLALRNTARAPQVHSVVAGLGGRSITRQALHKVFRRALVQPWEGAHFLDLNESVIAKELHHVRKVRRSGPTAENILRHLRESQRPSRPNEEMLMNDLTAELPDSQKLRFYQKGTFTVGNRLVSEAERSVQASIDRSNALTCGHRACQGCGEALGARYAVDAAMRVTNGQLIAVNATGCLEVFTTPYPETSWQLAWLHSLFGNAAAVATGVAAAMRVKGRKDVRTIAQGGDGGTTDIGFGCLSGMFERNDDVLYICYDNEAYMNTGVQRSSATPPAARTATTPAMGEEPGNVFGTGKSVPRIAMAHDIPYVATATVADLHDLERKVIKAMGIHGARYIHVHVPCPLGWGSASHDTIRLARLAVESGLFPVFEAEHGKVIASRKIRNRVPVTDYLKPQKRFAHLFASDEGATRVAKLQAMADRNISEYHLLNGEGDA